MQSDIPLSGVKAGGTCDCGMESDIQRVKAGTCDCGMQSDIQRIKAETCG